MDRGELDREPPRRAPERIVARQEALRRALRLSDGEPKPRVAAVDERGIPLLEHDRREHTAPAAEAELGRLAAEEANALFSLERGRSSVGAWSDREHGTACCW